MTLYEFNSLDDDDDKLAAVLSCGECIASREEKGKTIMLYQLPAFYVEIYSREQNEVGVRFRSFSSLEQLRPYLDQIDISKLI